MTDEAKKLEKELFAAPEEDTTEVSAKDKERMNMIGVNVADMESHKPDDEPQDLVTLRSEEDEPQDLVTYAEKEAPHGDGEEKPYLILIYGAKDEKEYRDWYIASNRDGAYDYIKSYLLNDEVAVDLEQSCVLVGPEKLEDIITVEDFLEHVIKNDLISWEDNYPHLDEYVESKRDALDAFQEV